MVSMTGPMGARPIESRTTAKLDAPTAAVPAHPRLLERGSTSSSEIGSKRVSGHKGKGSTATQKGKGVVKVATMHLVDLAGSECAKKTGASGARALEARNSQCG